MKRIAIDLFCGLGGWTEGLQAAGYRVIGFDIERHQYGDKKYPAELVLQDILTLHGAQFKDAALIVASPPCQKYSYMAMPWTRAKDLIKHYEASEEARQDLNALFDACFRIQREANEAAGHHIPMVVENVKGAQRWVGRAKWHYGSFYLWGDVPALMPPVSSLRKSQHTPLVNTPAGTGSTSWFFGNSKHEGRFYGTKTVGHVNKRDGHGHTRHLTNQRESDAYKQQGLSGPAWFDQGAASHSSRSNARKQASAEIAKIPFPLAKWIGEVYAMHRLEARSEAH